MAFSFIDSKSYLYTSESVTEGHPDKLCDQVSDSILDAIYEQDPLARVACETATTTNLVVVIGEITTTATVNYEEIARKTLKSIGYNNPNTGIDWQTCEVVVKIHEQSPNINAAVSTALEHRNTNSIDNTEVDATPTPAFAVFKCVLSVLHTFRTPPYDKNDDALCQYSY